MTAFFVVVQFVPDPIIDERINFGVLVYGDGVVRRRFLSTWDRVKQFAGRDVGFLLEFAERTSGWDESTIARVAGRQRNCIQVTKPRASLLSPERLLAEVGQRFLVENQGTIDEERKETVLKIGGSPLSSPAIPSCSLASVR